MTTSTSLPLPSLPPTGPPVAVSLEKEEAKRFKTIASELGFKSLKRTENRDNCTVVKLDNRLRYYKTDQFKKIDSILHVLSAPSDKQIKAEAQLKPIMALPEPTVKSAEMEKKEAPKKINYGNKYEGLVKVDTLIKSQRLQGVEVPLPNGLSHDQVESFLNDHHPEIAAKWQNLNSLLQQHLKDKSVSPAAFLNNIEATVTLEQIREAIQSSFDSAGKEEAEINKYFLGDLKPWIEGIKKKDAFLAVRSSSREDSKTAPNAGGNLSKSYVKPEFSEILSACGEVVASYFTETSLKNLLEAGVNPFATPMVLSVILQELIGEPPGGSAQSDQMPISLVMFTNEPTYTEKGFRITKISTVLGHGEGVVNNLSIASDTVYALRSNAEPGNLVEIYQNSEKVKRLAPVLEAGKVNLKPILNPPTKMHDRCLDSAMVKRLIELGNVVEEGLGGPIDMEIVIKNGIINVVQARPVVRPDAAPTYLSDSLIEQQKMVIPFTQVKQVKVQVPGKSSVEIITDPKEILVCDTLLEANEKAFIKGQHKLICIGIKEPKNSHPIVNFSSMGIPCFYYKNLEEIRSLIGQITPDKCLLACTQSGRIGLWNTADPHDKAIAVGYYSHPAEVVISLDDLKHSPPRVALPVVSELPTDIQQTVRAMKEAATDKVALDALNNLKQAPLVTSLQGRIKNLQTEIKQAKHIPTQALGALEVMEKLEKKVNSTFAEIEKSYKEPKPRLERLFHVKTLESLLKSEEQEAVHSYSLLHVEPLSAAAKKAIEFQKPFDFPLQTLDLLHIGEIGLDKKHEKLWETFLIGIEKAIQAKAISVADLLSFKKMLQMLEHNNALALWFNVAFLPENAKISDPVKVFQALLSANPKEDELKLLDSQCQELKDFKRALSDFGEPLKIITARKKLNEFAGFISSSEFTSLYAKGSLITKLVASQLMKSYVETADEAIKTMKKSPSFTDDQKAQILESMLNSNYEVLKVWLKDLLANKDLPFITGWNLERYLKEMIENPLKLTANQSNSLQASVGFSVLPAVINSLTNFIRHPPKTLEDIFTLIHQNQLFVISSLFNSLIPKNVDSISAPPLFIETSNLLNAMHFQNSGVEQLEQLAKIGNINLKNAIPSRSGLEIVPQGIKLLYNIPLRNHSAAVTLVQNKSNPSVEMHVKLYGNARNRWGTYTDYLKALFSTGVFQAAEMPRFSPVECSFGFTIPDLKSASQAIALIRTILIATLLTEGESQNVISEFATKENFSRNIGKWVVEQPKFYQQYSDFAKSYLTEPEVIKQIKEPFLKSVEPFPWELERLATIMNYFDMTNRPLDQLFLEMLPKYIQNYTLPVNIWEDKLTKICYGDPEALPKLHQLILQITPNYEDPKTVENISALYRAIIAEAKGLQFKIEFLEKIEKRSEKDEADLNRLREIKEDCDNALHEAEEFARSIPLDSAFPEIVYERAKIFMCFKGYFDMFGPEADEALNKHYDLKKIFTEGELL